MSYSRWGESRWYTFWSGQDAATENRDTAIFEICGVVSFEAKELRESLDACVKRAAFQESRKFLRPVTDDDRDELRGYMVEFLADVDREYPLEV